MSGTSKVEILHGFDYGIDEKIMASHYSEWSRLREQYGCFGSDADGDYTQWYLLKYDAGLAALQDWETFSSKSVMYKGEIPPEPTMIPEELDPPEHIKYRQLLSAPLSPGNVALMETQIRQRCGELIDALKPRGGCDLVTEFSKQFPTSIFLKWMGIPVEATEELVKLANTAMHTTAIEDPDGSIRGAANMGIVAHFATAIAQRRVEPQNDFITALVQSKVDGQDIPDEKLYAIGFLLYLAGLDTVANVLSYSFSHLAKSPDLRHDLTANPDKWPTAIEEFLRFYTLPTTARVVTKDTEFAGCPMKANDRIIVPLAAMNRDPEQFPDADTLVPDRKINRHVAFGAGPHRCVGSHLARLELRIAMEEWHKRIPDYKIPEGAVITEHVGSVAGLDTLPLVW